MSRARKALRIAILLLCVLFALVVLALPLSVFGSTDGGGTWANYGRLAAELLTALTPIFLLVFYALLLAERYFSYRCGTISKNRLLRTTIILAIAATLTLAGFLVLLHRLDSAMHGTIS